MSSEEIELKKEDSQNSGSQDSNVDSDNIAVDGPVNGDTSTDTEGDIAGGQPPAEESGKQGSEDELKGAEEVANNEENVTEETFRTDGFEDLPEDVKKALEKIPSATIPEAQQSEGGSEIEKVPNFLDFYAIYLNLAEAKVEDEWNVDVIANTTQQQDLGFFGTIFSFLLKYGLIAGVIFLLVKFGLPAFSSIRARSKLKKEQKAFFKKFEPVAPSLAANSTTLSSVATQSPGIPAEPGDQSQAPITNGGSEKNNSGELVEAIKQGEADIVKISSSENDDSLTEAEEDK